MAIVGYARVSSVGQSLEVQMAKLAHCDKVFNEKKSGTTTSQREAFKNCMEYIREGDTLVVTKLDRLARSIGDLCKIMDELQRKNVALTVLDQNIDTSTPSGRLMFGMLGVFAQFENELRAERQAEGIKKAINKGVKFGRSLSLTNEEVEELRKDRESGMGISQLMKRYKVGRSTIYRYLGA